MKTKKLFLASFTAYVVDELAEFIGKKPDDTKIAFIPTAANPYEDRWFVDKERNELVNKGFRVTDFDIKNRNENKLFSFLSNFDAVVVAGGNVFYLLEKSLEVNFKSVLKKLLDNGVIYVGGSAGAALVGPSLEPVESLDDPSKAPNLKSFDGLSIVDFVVLPHAGEEKYKDKYDQILEKFKHFKYKVIPITNYQAIEVVGDKYKVVEKNI